MYIILTNMPKNNSEKAFEFSYFDNIDDALTEGLDQNQDFFSLLLAMMKSSARCLVFCRGNIQEPVRCIMEEA